MYSGLSQIVLIPEKKMKKVAMQFDLDIFFLPFFPIFMTILSTFNLTFTYFYSCSPPFHDNSEADQSQTGFNIQIICLCPSR